MSEAQQTTPLLNAPGAYPPAPGVPPPGYGAQQPQMGYAMPPQGGYPQTGFPQPYAATTIVTNVPTHPLGSTVRFGEIPTAVTCQFCGAQVMTGQRFVNGMLTWLAVGGIAFFGGIFGCCLIPFCIDGCKDVEHVCPNCKAVVGVYRRMN